MAATIKIKNSSTASAVPTSSDLVQGELAVNVTDKRIFTENASGTVVELGTNPSILTLPDGSASAPTLTNDGDTNTGIFFPAADTVGITTGGTERARVDSSGNLGLGVTPSAWQSASKSLDLYGGGSLYSNNSSNDVRLSLNTYVNSGGSDTYKTTNYATIYKQNSGQHIWQTAASGTAGSSITYTQAMTLDASGNLGVGTTSPNSKLEVTSRITASDGGGASRIALNIESNTSAQTYSAINSYNYGTSAARNLVLNESGGNVMAGTTNTSLENSRSFAWIGSSGGLFRVNHSTSNGSGDGYIEFGYNGTKIGSITQNGTTGVLFNITSDYRLKTVTGAVSGHGERIDALEPVEYTWNSDGSVARGFLAHKFQEVYPSSVSGEKDAVDEDGNPKYQNMQASTSEVIADLVAEIKSLRIRIAALEA